MYCTTHYSSHITTVSQQAIAVLHTTFFSRQCHSNTAGFHCCAHHIFQQTVSLNHNNLSLYCTPHYSSDSATLAPYLYKLFSYNHYLCPLFPTPTAVQFKLSIQQQTFSEPFIRLWLYCNICYIIIYRSVQQHLLDSCYFCYSSPYNIYYSQCGKLKNCIISLIISFLFDIPTR